MNYANPYSPSGMETNSEVDFASLTLLAPLTTVHVSNRLISANVSTVPDLHW